MTNGLQQEKYLQKSLKQFKEFYNILAIFTEPKNQGQVMSLFSCKLRIDLAITS